MENLFDLDNDFTEEEEDVFTTGVQQGKVTMLVAKTGQGKSRIITNPLPTLEEGLIAKYKAGVPVAILMKVYGLSTGRLYDILRTNNVELRGSSNHVGSTKPANILKKAITKDGYIFTSDLADRYGLTSGQVRSYCLVLEDQGYKFSRIQRGQRDARIFNNKDIEILDRMTEELRVHSMVESAVLALYNHDVQPPKVDVKIEGETLFINIARTPNWTAEEINVTINLSEEE